MSYDILGHVYINILAHMRSTLFKQISLSPFGVLWFMLQSGLEVLELVPDLDDAKLTDALLGCPIPTINDHRSPQDYQGCTKYLLIEMLTV